MVGNATLMGTDEREHALSEISQVKLGDLPLLDINTIAIMVQVGQEEKAKQKLGDLAWPRVIELEKRYLCLNIELLPW